MSALWLGDRIRGSPAEEGKGRDNVWIATDDAIELQHCAKSSGQPGKCCHGVTPCEAAIRQNEQEIPHDFQTLWGVRISLELPPTTARSSDTPTWCCTPCKIVFFLSCSAQSAPSCPRRFPDTASRCSSIPCINS